MYICICRSNGVEKKEIKRHVKSLTIVRIVFHSEVRMSSYMLKIKQNNNKYLNSFTTLNSFSTLINIEQCE